MTAPAPAPAWSRRRVPLNVTLPPVVIDLLTDLAKKSGCSRSELIERLVTQAARKNNENPAKQK